MPHSYGYRARTRDLFSKKFKDNGRLPLTVYLRQYKVWMQIFDQEIPLLTLFKVIYNHSDLLY